MKRIIITSPSRTIFFKMSIFQHSPLSRLTVHVYNFLKVSRVNLAVKLVIVTLRQFYNLYLTNKHAIFSFTQRHTAVKQNAPGPL